MQKTGGARGPITLRWVEGRNFGDAMSPLLTTYLTGAEPIQAGRPGRLFPLRRRSENPVYGVIGSIISQLTMFKNSAIWGAGFKRPQDRVWFKPALVTAVRGPLSRSKLLELDIDCPAIYGDPALLFPRYYKPDLSKKFSLGIVPHMFDQNSKVLNNLCARDDVKLIDVRQDVHNVVDDIASCELIASSSLHGIIVADAYGIPSRWIKFSNIVGGSGFKFMDYFLSVGRVYREPLEITSMSSIRQIIAGFESYQLDIDLDKLLASCPFDIVS